MIVMKFGGTSVGGGRQLRNVAALVAQHQDRQPVVVSSAMRGVTDLLLGVASAAAAGERRQVRQVLRELRERHFQAVNEALDDPTNRHEVHRDVATRLAQLRRSLMGVTLLGELSPRSRDQIAGWGEGCLVPILAGTLREQGLTAQVVGGERVIVTDDRFGEATPNLAATTRQVEMVLQPLLAAGTIPVVSGFVGATPAGVKTILGRGASDYTASILAHALDASEVWIWTDVNGVLTADPNLVATARPIPILSYAEAAELSYFGAKVIHPRTMVPVASKEIPIRILNSFEPAFPGTLITSTPGHSSQPVRALTSIGKTTLLTVEGSGLVGSARTVARACSVMAAHDTNILLLSQSSSEHNICFVVPASDGELLQRALTKEFTAELASGELSSIGIKQDVCILAAIGSGMRGAPGVAGSVFATLGRHNCNILAIAQGGSELNISCVLRAADEAQAMQALHKELIINGHQHNGAVANELIVA